MTTIAVSNVSSMGRLKSQILSLIVFILCSGRGSQSGKNMCEALNTICMTIILVMVLQGKLHHIFELP